MLAVTNPTCGRITTFSDTAPTLLGPRFCKRNRALPLDAKTAAGAPGALIGRTTKRQEWRLSVGGAARRE
jgi:hypothetical protein